MNDDETRLLRLAIERQIAQQRDWRIPMRNGMLQGIGAALGATVVVSLALWVMKPLERIDAFRPVLEKLSEELSKR